MNRILAALSAVFAWLAEKTHPASRRLIFRYFDGEKMRAADPDVILRGFQRHPTFKIAEDPIAAALDEEAYDRMIQASLDVFQVKAFDGVGGLTQAETLQLFYQFNDYVDALKKNMSVSATSSPPTDSPLPDSATLTSQPSA